MNINEIEKLSNIKNKKWLEIEHLYCRDQSLGFDYKSGIKNLKTIKDILDSKNLNFWLAFGTLLGAIRNKDFISYDDDIDFFMYEEEVLSEYEFLKKEFISAGFIFRNWQKSIGTKINLYRYKQLCTIDGLALDTNYNEYRVTKRWKFPRQYFENYDTVEFKGMRFRVPSPSEDFLSFLYKDWKKPINPKDISKPNKWRSKSINKKKDKK